MDLEASREIGASTSSHLETCVIRDGEDNLLCVGFKKSPAKSFVYNALGVFTGCFIFLLGYWNPYQRVRFTHKRCPLRHADLVVIETKEGERSFCKVQGIEIASNYCIKTGEWKLSDCGNRRQHCTYRYLVYKFVRFLWDDQEETFVKLIGLDNALNTKTLLTAFVSGISEEQRNDLLKLYGPNQINVPVKSFVRIFFELSLNPFYLFQLCSCILWITDDYIWLSVFILSISLVGLCLSTYQTRKRLHDIISMIAKSQQVNVLGSLSSGSRTAVHLSSERLVPGDVIVLNQADRVLFDAVVVSGACVVNESMLTGESVPIHKTSIGDLEVKEDIYSSNFHTRQTLYNGTDILRVISGPEGACAVVIGTGFSTAKGNLIRNVLSTKPVGFTLFRDSLRFILMIAVVAFCGFLYSVVILVRYKTPVGQIVRRALDTITIAVSPALPIALTLGTLLAIRQLNLRRIYCTDMPKINSCGKIKLVCFDKTGTLTESDLKLSSIIAPKDGQLKRRSHIGNFRSVMNTELVKAMSCCHSLTIINDIVVGEPLDEEIFRHCQRNIKESSRIDGERHPLCCIVTDLEDVNDVLVWKHFLFDSHVKRMGVLATDIERKRATIIVKGAPEVIEGLCIPCSIPADFQRCLTSLTRSGYRVIAYGKKEEEITEKLKLDILLNLPREEMERNLCFLGFVVLENMLKHETQEVICELKTALIRTVMATGDNLGTGVCVGLQSGILDPGCPIYEVEVDETGNVKYNEFKDLDFKGLNSSNKTTGEEDRNLENLEVSFEDDFESEKKGFLSREIENKDNFRQPQLVLTGSEFMKLRQHNWNVYEKVLLLGRIFARMTPDQKASLVLDLQSLGLTTCMCGDGANDCMALKAAEASISLSESEASIAAPFTSSVRNISCVSKLIREGRSALVTSFTCFQFLVLYCMIQFISVLVLYSVNSLLSNNQFLFIDIVYSMTLFMSIIEVRSSPQLASKRPYGKLFHPVFATAVLGQVAIQLSFQLLVFFYVQHMGWYKPPYMFTARHSTLVRDCYENTVIFIYSTVQYVTAAIISCKGPPFREKTYLNVRFSSICIALIVLLTFLMIHPGHVIQELLNLVELPYIFGVSLVLIGLGNAYCSYIFDECFLPSHFFKRTFDFIRRKKGPRNRYKHVTLDLMCYPHTSNIDLRTTESV